MKKKLVFMSSLPRSGSTVLSRILSQNPEIYSSPTSGLLDTLFAIRNNWWNLIENKAMKDQKKCEETLLRVLRGVVDSYYGDTQQPIVCDKSRGHNAYLGFWKNIMQEKPKVIVTVRPIVEILASLEKLHRETAKVRQPPFEAEYYMLMQTQDGRCQTWLAAENLVGLAFNRIHEAINIDRSCLHFVDFDNLTNNPKEVLKGIYDFIEEDCFNHDFNNIPTENFEADEEIHGYVNLHTTRPKLEPVKSNAKQILGTEIYNKYKQFTLNID